MKNEGKHGKKQTEKGRRRKKTLIRSERSMWNASTPCLFEHRLAQPILTPHRSDLHRTCRSLPDVLARPEAESGPTTLEEHDETMQEWPKTAEKHAEKHPKTCKKFEKPSKSCRTPRPCWSLITSGCRFEWPGSCRASTDFPDGGPAWVAARTARSIDVYP